ncbi:MAG TPA: RDD family protein [Verrucomicrobiae bacterium]|nr:RDD family protein [Verrucomicrobiae bacterium]
MTRSILYLSILIVGSLSHAQDADTNNTPESSDIPFQITTSSGNDRVAVGGGSVHVKPGEVVHDVVVVGGSALIEGKVTGDCTVVFGKAKITSTAEIRKDLTVVFGTLDVDPDAKIRGQPTIVGPNTKMQMPAAFRWVPQWFSKGLMLGRPLPHQFAWAWIAVAVFTLFYLLLALLFRGPIGACVHVLETRPGSSLLTGLLALLLFGPLLILLLITVIGSILIPFLICAAIAAYFFGKVVVYACAGQQIVGNRMGPLLPVLIGAILFSLLYVIPVVGFLVWGVAAPLGLGAVLLAFFGRLRKEDPKPPISTPSVPPPPAPVAPPPGTAPAYSMTPLSPRAGFWLRFLGTAIDAALLLVICGIFHIHAPPPVILGIWTLYHIALWTYKGATIGGLVVGTRIIRTDGSPIDLSVAVVRALASFLSAAAFLLGFFWAGWSAQKQSWHDIIAGAYVVKTRTALQPAPVPAPVSQ